MGFGAREGSRVVVRRHDPLRRAWLGALVCGAFVTLLAFAFLAGRAVGAAHSRPVIDNSGTAVQRARLEQEHEEIEQQISNLTASLTVEREANVQVRDELAKSQRRIVQLEQETELYRGLLDTSLNQTGLALHDLTISKEQESGAYRVRITVLQRARKYAEIAGIVRIGVRGGDAKGQRVLSYDEIGLPRGSRGLPMRLLYFQTIEGRIRLPDGFTPQELVVDIAAAAGNRKLLAARRDWAEQE